MTSGLQWHSLQRSIPGVKPGSARFDATEGWLQLLCAGHSHTAEHLHGALLPVLARDCTTAFQRRLTLHTLSLLWQDTTHSYWIYFWSFWQYSICFLDQVDFPVFLLLWPGEKQTSPAQYITVGIWIICLQTRTRLLSEMGYQITEIRWHTASFPTSTTPVYSEQVTCKKTDFYNCSWISSHFLISWTATPSPDIHPGLSVWNILAQSW